VKKYERPARLKLKWLKCRWMLLGCWVSFLRTPWGHFLLVDRAPSFPGLPLPLARLSKPPCPHTSIARQETFKWTLITSTLIISHEFIIFSCCQLSRLEKDRSRLVSQNSFPPSPHFPALRSKLLRDKKLSSDINRSHNIIISSCANY
jgi:hypothetical protein